MTNERYMRAGQLLKLPAPFQVRFARERWATITRVEDGVCFGTPRRPDLPRVGLYSNTALVSWFYKTTEVRVREV